MSSFQTLIRRADTLRRLENDPIKCEWWAGYMRGLRRAHHGELFGTAAEHDLWSSAAESDNPSHRALGAGYQAGLTLTAIDPGT
jgi:hypothetical protein